MTRDKINRVQKPQFCTPKHSSLTKLSYGSVRSNKKVFVKRPKKTSTTQDQLENHRSCKQIGSMRFATVAQFFCMDRFCRFHLRGFFMIYSSGRHMLGSSSSFIAVLLLFNEPIKKKPSSARAIVICREQMNPE